VAPARGKFWSVRELIAFAGAKFKGGGSTRGSAKSKLRVAKVLAGEVGAVRRRIRAVGGGRGMSGERGRGLETGTRDQGSGQARQRRRGFGF
jgi:hypothetical protein